MKRILILIIFFYFLTVFQTSFLVFFPIKNLIINFILVSVIVLNFLTNDFWLGISSALIGGFFLDVFSENFFGFYILIFLAISLFSEFIFKKYVRLPHLQKF